MRIIVLGAAAGGGLPQWNCGCANCRAARAGRIPSLSQSSVAVSADGRDWAILNASPDIRTQMAATPALHPTGPRDMPMRAVLLTNGDIDHVAG
ncbi:MAG: MBL fold metallo-hydrolase, partial [Paracoccus sp. (in: a-proteobacteria)]